MSDGSDDSWLDNYVPSPYADPPKKKRSLPIDDGTNDYDVAGFFDDIEESPYAESVPAPVRREPDWVMDGKGRVVLNHHNAGEIFQTDEEWYGVLAYNEFSQCKMLMKNVPGIKGPFTPRELRDADYIEIIRWFNRNGYPNASKNTIVDCVDHECSLNIISPVRHWLESLEVEDRKSNILTEWAFTYLDVQAKTPDEIEYVRQVTSKWLISAVARALRPGCKADAVLILEGEQGAGKSSMIEALTGPKWFGDALPPMHTKDSSDYLRGKWIVELAELANVSKSEVEIVKAFLSRSEERFRPAYGRSEIRYPRACVFAGSTNRSDYLRDETGNRRFWPVKVGPKIDLDGLKKARPQIWAHAVQAFIGGAKWWLDNEADNLARQQQSQRLSEDEWIGPIADFLIGTNECCISGVCQGALEIEAKDVNKAVQNRVAQILDGLGFVKIGRMRSGVFRNKVLFRRSE